MKKILAFDIGGTKIAYAVVDVNGNLLTEKFKVNTPKTAQEIVNVLKSAITAYEDDVAAIAIATAGTVNPQNTKITLPPTNLPLGYNEIDFCRLSHKPVFIENDANAVAWAEYKKGSGEGFQHLVVVAIGTGVGLGIVVDGQLLKGKSGSAGEAHYPINRGQKRLCGCGAYDCFEIYASGKALAFNAQESFKNPTMTSEDLIKLKTEALPQAINVFDNWCYDIVLGLRSLASLFDPEAIILFGSLVEYMDIPKMEKLANQEIVVPSFKIKKAAFGNDAALVGVALLAASKENLF